MKSLPLILFSCILFCTTVSAQKKSILVTGSASYSDTKYSEWQTESEIDIRPSVGYGVSESWTIGLGLGYTKSEGYPAFKSYSVMPFAMYSRPISPMFSILGHFESGYARIIPDVAGEMNQFRFVATPVIEMNIKNNFAVNFSIGGLEYTLTKPEGGPTQRRFSYGLGQTATIGVSKRFERK